MAVTNQNIKDSISPEAGDVFGIGPKTVGNTELNRLKAWFEAEYSEELDGREATANDFAAFLWQQCAAKVKTMSAALPKQRFYNQQSLARGKDV